MLVYLLFLTFLNSFEFFYYVEICIMLLEDYKDIIKKQKKYIKNFFNKL